ncbi:MAG TPA: hypothetical protein VE130_14995 [Nitrososphaeraceae archaeon]|nr:hypothetical protein [Nitrososphaeraceae archaeon]
MEEQIEARINDAIPQIEDQIRRKLNGLPAVRFLLITKSQWLRVYNGKMEKRMELMELSFIRRLKPTRGNILDFFSKVESLIREMIQARILGLFSDQGYEFDDLLQRISLHDCVDIIKKWNMIDSNLQRKIKTLSSVRNQFAHCWSEKEVFYKKDLSNRPVSIIENIDLFKKDAEEIWLRLIEYYMKLEAKFIGRLISKLDDKNTIDAWSYITSEREKISRSC